MPSTVNCGQQLAMAKMTGALDRAKVRALLDRVAHRYLPGKVLKPKQIDALVEIGVGKDALIQLPTGYGKTAIMQLALPLLREVKSIPDAISIIICPLNSIIDNIISSTAEMGMHAQRASDMTRIVDFVIAHPEQLLDE